MHLVHEPRPCAFVLQGPKVALFIATLYIVAAMHLVHEPRPRTVVLQGHALELAEVVAVHDKLVHLLGCRCFDDVLEDACLLG